MGAESLPSPESGGSEGTTDNVFRQFGHMKQFRAHLFYTKVSKKLYSEEVIPILFSSDTRAWNFEQTIWAVVATNFYRNATVASDRVTLFAEEESMQGVKAEGRRRQMRRRRYR